MTTLVFWGLSCTFLTWCIVPPTSLTLLRGYNIKLGQILLISGQRSLRGARLVLLLGPLVVPPCHDTGSILALKVTSSSTNVKGAAVPRGPGVVVIPLALPLPVLRGH